MQVFTNQTRITNKIQEICGNCPKQSNCNKTNCQNPDKEQRDMLNSALQNLKQLVDKKITDLLYKIYRMCKEKNCVKRTSCNRKVCTIAIASTKQAVDLIINEIKELPVIVPNRNT